MSDQTFNFNIRKKDLLPAMFYGREPDDCVVQTEDTYEDFIKKPGQGLPINFYSKPVVQISADSDSIFTSWSMNIWAEYGIPPYTFSIFDNQSGGYIDPTTAGENVKIRYYAGPNEGTDTIHVLDSRGYVDQLTILITEAEGHWSDPIVLYFGGYGPIRKDFPGEATINKSALFVDVSVPVMVTQLIVLVENIDLYCTETVFSAQIGEESLEISVPWYTATSKDVYFDLDPADYQLWNSGTMDFAIYYIECTSGYINTPLQLYAGHDGTWERWSIWGRYWIPD